MTRILYSKTGTIIENECIYGNILITGTGHLTIQGNIEVGGNGTLTVEAGGDLIIDGGTISNVDLDLKPGATLRIINNGILEARHAFTTPIGAVVEIRHGKIIPTPF